MCNRLLSFNNFLISLKYLVIKDFFSLQVFFLMVRTFT